MRCIGYLKQLSVSLQGRAVDVIAAIGSVNLLKQALQDVRDNIDIFHGKWYSEILKLSELLDIEPSKPRTCGRQTQRGNVPCESVEDYFKKVIAIPLLDHILTEMNGRFRDLQVKASIGLHILPSLTKKASPSDFEYFVDDLPSPETLSQELYMWKLKWESCKDTPSDLQSAILKCDKLIFPNVFKILQICGIFPVTSCECERSISVIRLVKTYLKSTMPTHRAASLVTMYTHRGIDIKPENVIRRFVTRNPRRMILPDILI